MVLFLCVCRLQSSLLLEVRASCCVVLKGLLAKKRCRSVMGRMLYFDQQLLCLLEHPCSDLNAARTPPDS